MRKFISQYILVSTLFVSCTNPTKQRQSVISPSAAVNKNISIEQVGELRSRRSFASIQFMDDSLEIEQYIQKQEKANPTFSYPTDSSLLKRFEALGFAKESELLLSEFQFDTISHFHLKEATGKIIDVMFDHVLRRTGEHKLTVSYKNDSVRMNIPGHMQALQYTLLDVVPGGNRELVLLDEYYIMNGYNFDFYVYEIKTGN